VSRLQEREDWTLRPHRRLDGCPLAVLQYLSCSTWKIRKLVMDGKLQYVADSDDTDQRFDIFDLDAFIDFNKRREETIG